MTNEQAKLPDGLQLAVNLIGVAMKRTVFRTEEEHFDMAAVAIRAEHQQHLTLMRRAADQAQRIADLEAERAALRTKLAEIEAQAVPNGWRLVPVEPTPEMLHSALIASRDRGEIHGSGGSSVLPVCFEIYAADLVYRAMTESAPGVAR